MRKSLLLLLPFALIPLAGLALPATAGSGVPGTTAEPIDLGSVPVKAVTGRLAISGIAVDDESDDMPAVGKGVRASIGADDERLAAEAEVGEAD
jgi:hypothetical protein